MGLVRTLALVGVLLGCNSSSPKEHGVGSAKPLRVALVLPGNIDDGAWSQDGYEGLQRIKKELGAQTAYAEDVLDLEDGGAAVFRRFAREGFDFVVGLGGEYLRAAEVVAQEYPLVKFAIVGAHPGNNKNLGALRFRDGELGYLTGVVAGLATRTRKIAYIGGVDYRHLREQARLFERGAKSIDPGIAVSVRWLGSWTDEALMRRTARALIQQGADVLSVRGNITTRAGIEEAQAAGVFAIGWYRDQHDVAPGTVLTSGIEHIGVLLLAGARMVRELRWEGRQYHFGIRDGAVDLAPVRGLPAAAAARVAAVREDIVAGKIDVSP